MEHNVNQGAPGSWRIAVINREKNPCAIIRSDGPWGDEFVASDISIADARILASLGICDCLPSTAGIAQMDDTDWHVLAQDISHYWTRPEEQAVAYRAAGEAIKLLRLAQAIEAEGGDAETGPVRKDESAVGSADAPNT